jgi:hypothetical protein
LAVSQDRLIALYIAPPRTTTPMSWRSTRRAPKRLDLLQTSGTEKMYDFDAGAAAPAS